MCAVHDGRCSPWVMCSVVSGNRIHDTLFYPPDCFFFYLLFLTVKSQIVLVLMETIIVSTGM